MICNAYRLCFVVTTAAAGIFGSAISSPVSSLESEGRPLTLVTREISSVVADDIELDAPGAETTVESGSWPSWRLLTQWLEWFVLEVAALSRDVTH